MTRLFAAAAALFVVAALITQRNEIVKLREEIARVALEGKP